MTFLQRLTRSAREGVGQPVLRKEDGRLLVGAGRYSDDVDRPGQAYACFVRSLHAHARIEGIDTLAARATPGVIAVLTGADAVADGVRPLTHVPMPASPHEVMVRPGDVSFVAPHPPMPADRVRCVGEAVALVVADTPAAACDGAERVLVDWTPLPAVTAGLAAGGPGAPLLYDDTPSNVCVGARVGDPVAVGDAFARAAHVVSLETWVQRVTGANLQLASAVTALADGTFVTAGWMVGDTAFGTDATPKTIAGHGISTKNVRSGLRPYSTMKFPTGLVMWKMNVLGFCT